MVTLTVVCAPLLVVQPAHATFSIVAAGLNSHQVGAASASCAGDYALSRTFRSVPGTGALVGQGSRAEFTRDRAQALMDRGETLEGILSKITDDDFDPRSQYRQYGLVTVMGDARGFTGSSCESYARDRQGILGDYRFSVQGNILTGAEVIEALWDGFGHEACDLAGHLMNALAEVRGIASGDRRCTEAAGTSSDAAFLRVDSAQGKTLVEFEVNVTAPHDAVQVLQSEFEQWRQREGCIEASDVAGTEPASLGMEGDYSLMGGGGCAIQHLPPGSDGWPWLIPYLGTMLYLRRSRQGRPSPHPR